MNTHTIEALKVLQVTQNFAIYELRDPDPGVTASLYQSSADMFDPQRGQYIRIMFPHKHPHDTAINEIIAWMQLNDLKLKIHRTRWGTSWFDIHLSRDQLIDYRLRWG